MSRYFAFLYVEDMKVSSLLNTAIAVLNPRAKWPAHVTVAGPFSSARNLPRDRVYYRTMLIMGTGQFRSEVQNTVYLNVGTFDLKRISRKPDYGFKPHMTLYDGPNHELGDRLFRRLRDAVPLTKLDVSRLYLVKTGDKQAAMTFLLEKLDNDFVKELGLTWSMIESLDVGDRIEIAVAALNQAIEAARGPATHVVSSLHRKSRPHRWTKQA